MLGVVQLETRLVQEAGKVGPNLLFFSSSLNWDVRCYLGFRIPSPTARECSTYTHVRAAPAPGSIER